MSARRDPPTGHYLRVAPMTESTGLVSEHLSPLKIRIDCEFLFDCSQCGFHRSPVKSIEAPGPHLVTGLSPECFP